MALFHAEFFSDTLGMCTKAEVIIPQPSKKLIGMKADGGGKPYKTLYLLHGMSDDETIWLRRTSIERYAADYGIAVVMPTTHLGWYTDMAHGLKWWTYVSQELPTICRDFFALSDKREDNFAAGLSMGGYGALKLGLGAGETFSAVASLSGGGFDFAKMNSTMINDDNRRFWEDVFGTFDSAIGSDNDLLALAGKRKASGVDIPKIYMWTGTEDFVYADNLTMRDRLQSLGYDLTYEESPGDHQWKYWDEKIQRVLEWLPIKNK